MGVGGVGAWAVSCSSIQKQVSCLDHEMQRLLFGLMASLSALASGCIVSSCKALIFCEAHQNPCAKTTSADLEVRPV